MNKTKLQQELNKKIKLGVKPSDFKKPPKKNSQINQQLATPPDSPLLKPTKPSQPANNLKDLQEQVKYWSQTAQNHLLNLSKTSAELFEAEEIIKEFEQPKPQTLNQAAEQALIEANQKIRELQSQNTALNTNYLKPKKPSKKQRRNTARNQTNNLHLLRLSTNPTYPAIKSTICQLLFLPCLFGESQESSWKRKVSTRTNPWKLPL